MISSDVDVAPRSLADQLSDFSNRFDHEQDQNNNNILVNEANGYKKLTPALFTSK